MYVLRIAEGCRVAVAHVREDLIVSHTADCPDRFRPVRFCVQQISTWNACCGRKMVTYAPSIGSEENGHSIYRSTSLDTGQKTPRSGLWRNRGIEISMTRRNNR